MKKVYVSFDDIQRQTQDIIRQLHQDQWRPDYVVGITRGGLTPAVLISQYLDTRMESLDVRLRDSYGPGPESNLWMSEDAVGATPEEERDHYGRYDPAFRKNILIVDDINDSGETFNWIKQDWQSTAFPDDPVWENIWGNTVRFAVLYENTASNIEVPVSYYATEINKIDDPSWIVFPWEEWWRRWNPNEEVIA